MTSRARAAIAAIAIGCAGMGAFAAAGFGDDAADGGSDPPQRHRIVHPALEPAAGSAPAALRADAAPARRPKPKSPAITNLITTAPVAVAAGEEVVAELRCTRAQGIPLDGGAISPPAPAQVAISVISRFSPNPPFEAPRQGFFVGVRNLDPVNPAEFRATLVCAKGIDER